MHSAIQTFLVESHGQIPHRKRLMSQNKTPVKESQDTGSSTSYPYNAGGLVYTQPAYQ